MDAALFGAALSLAPGVGRVRYRELLDRLGDLEAALGEVSEETGREALIAAGRELLARADAAGAKVLPYGDASYPARLRELADPPQLLFACGALGWLDERPVVAIVGTRAATAYGERVTREIAAQLARAGALVVSGMARGIDAAAHRGALGAGGRTGAVLGTGIDVP